MSHLGKIFHIARISIETCTPLSIATGNNDGVFDMSLVRDANDLPSIPASSIAGVLRHLYWQEHGQEAMQAVFGYQQGSEAQASYLQLSWGMIQNAQGKAIQGLCLGRKQTELQNDLILKVALESKNTPIIRDRVSLNHRGTAKNTGKFTRSILPSGYRFSLEVSLWHDEKHCPAWERILQLFYHPLFRLGGATRAGLGKIKVIAMHTMSNDLSSIKGRRAFSKLSRDINKLTGFALNNRIKINSDFKQVIHATLILRPKNYWRIGAGTKAHLGGEKPADMLPKVEPRIMWNKQNNAIPSAEKLLVPASSIKGALAHRIRFHENCDEQIWAEEFDAMEAEELCETVPNLFGTANDNQDHENDTQGQVGNILIDDAYIPFSTDDLQILMHNSIDRFSGSVRDHMLFSEEMVWKKSIKLTITINHKEAIDLKSRQAFALALADLYEGRLAIGAGASKGHGFCTGSITWSDQGQWINQKEEETV